ncbi:hypothetical protein ACFY2K_26325 [Kitasatospora sp. NPDC001309]|uniref:hypothetical protein n=1 Tax=Kitasatospora sp. NPDC001309 TaxID=3364013 RepID=UPI0036B05752
MTQKRANIIGLILSLVLLAISVGLLTGFIFVYDWAEQSGIVVGNADCQAGIEWRGEIGYFIEC